MVETMSAEPRQGSDTHKLTGSTTPVTGEAAICALQQRVTGLEEARYEALRAVRDATQLAGELGLQALEARMRLCALTEHEPRRTREGAGTGAHEAVLRLAQMYFDDASKYRLAMYAHPDEPSATSGGEADPIWCSEVVYDSMRPEANGRIAISDAIRKAYQAAERRGYRFVWATWVEARPSRTCEP
jgi:hypothetical protein